MRWTLFCLLVAVAFGAFVTYAQPEQPAPAPASAQAQTSDDAPVVLPPPSEKAVRFYKSGIVLWLVNEAWSLIVPAVILFSGFSARMRNLARWVGRNWFFTIAFFAVFYTVATFIADLPIGYYIQFVRMHEYGLSNQTFLKWWSDTLISTLVDMAGGALFLWVPYLLLKKSPKRWWLYTGLIMYVLVAVLYLIKPVYIDPLYNTFGPMKDKALEQKILALADRAGIEGSHVYEVEKSEDTKTYNAYVTGILQTSRIVLWDTTIKGLTEDELMYVMAHEMGHYVLKHAYSGILFIGTLILIGLYVIHRTSGFIIARYKDRIGFDTLSDVASYPLIMFLFTATMFVIEPLSNTYSRYHEHEADRFGLELVQTNHAAASAFAKLYAENLGYPNPHFLVKLWRATHPPIGERVAFCNEYKPWATGQPLRYGHLFKAANAASP